MRAGYDYYGHPTVELRAAYRQKLSAQCCALSAEAYVAKVSAAKRAVAQLRGDAPGDDLAALLELCAHARSTSGADYAEQVAGLSAWIGDVAESDEVSVSSYEDTLGSRSSSERSVPTKKRKRVSFATSDPLDIAKVLCAFGNQ